MKFCTMLTRIYRERVNFTASQYLQFKFRGLLFCMCEIFFMFYQFTFQKLALNTCYLIPNILKVLFSPKSSIIFFSSRWFFSMGRSSYTKHKYFRPRSQNLKVFSCRSRRAERSPTFRDRR